MDPSFVQNFREYIELSTSDLQTSLNAFLTHETLQYDVIYEKFLKTIENYKISMLQQMKLQLFPGSLVTEQQKEHVLLQQMKSLVSIKIREAVEKLNNETDVRIRQKLIEQLGVLNESLQKIETNLIPYENENIKQGAATSRSDLSMVLQGFQHNDEARGMIGPAQMTPIARKLSNNNSDYSAVSKFGLTDHKVDAFNTANPQSDLLSKVPPRPSGSGVEGGSGDVPALNLININHRKTEHTEQEKPTVSLPTGNQGMSLFQMFDACLSNITEKHKKSQLNQNPELNKKEKQESISTSNQNSTITSSIPEAGLTKPSLEVPKIQEKGLGESKFAKEAIKEDRRISYSPEKKQGLTKYDIDLRNLQFSRKLTNIVMRRYFAKWKEVPAEFRGGKYEEEFDLLHGDIDGIGGMDRLDTDKLVEDPVRRGVLTPIENREDYASDYGKTSFYDNDAEPERFMRYSEIEERFGMQPQNKPEKENETRQQQQQAGKKSPMIDTSPSQFGAKSMKKPLTGSSPRNHSQERLKDASKPKVSTNITKSPRVSTQKKEPEKPKMDMKSSLNKASVKSPAIPTKGSVGVKTGLPPTNKENSFANRASPTKPIKRPVTGNK